MEPFKNVETLKQFYTDGSYEYVRLMDSKGNTLITKNKFKKDGDTNFKKILTRLKAKSTPDGIYQVAFCVSPSACQAFWYHKGKVTQQMIEENEELETNQPPRQPRQHLSQSPNVLTWDEALKAHSELAEARAELKILQAEHNRMLIVVEEKDKKIAELEKELAEIEYVDEENENLAAPPVTPPKSDMIQFLEGIAPAAKAFIGEYFETQKMKMQMLYNIHNQKNGIAPPPPPPAQQQQQQQNANLTQEDVAAMDAVLDSMYQAEPAFKEWLTKISEGTKSVEETLQRFASGDPNRYKIFIEKLKSLTNGK